MDKTIIDNPRNEMNKSHEVFALINNINICSH